MLRTVFLDLGHFLKHELRLKHILLWLFGKHFSLSGTTLSRWLSGWDPCRAHHVLPSCSPTLLGVAQHHFFRPFFPDSHHLHTRSFLLMCVNCIICSCHLLCKTSSFLWLLQLFYPSKLIRKTLPVHLDGRHTLTTLTNWCTTMMDHNK